jgi:aminoglycoside 6'-N-acetyltransferase
MADTRPIVSIVLRPLREGDVAELLRIHQTPQVARWWGPPEPGFPWADEPGATRLAVESEGALVGMVQWSEEPTQRYRHASIDLFLDPAVHGHGIGSEVVRRVAGILFDERGHHRITIDPALANRAAIRAYEKAGFERVGVMRRYERDADGEGWHDGLLMELLAHHTRA